MLAMDPFHFDFFAMGSPCELKLYATDRERALAMAETAIAEVRRIEQKYSRYRRESYLSEINVAAKLGRCISVESETAALLDHAFEAHALSGGLFDVTCGVMREIWNDDLTSAPKEADISSVLCRVGLQKLQWERPVLTFLSPGMELDFGGIGKEYAADRAASLCRSRAVAHGLVNLGGDIAVVGPHPDGTPWRIGINDPLGTDTAVATLFVERGGIATSGNYERYWEIKGHRYGHAINPKTAWPVEGLPSVTVGAETCLAAGMASTIAILMGKGGPDWLRRFGADHLYVDDNGQIHGSVLSAADAGCIRC
jgi:thiamine biosynthesis lipoprotein